MRKNREKQPNNSGFTLVEVMLAIILIVVFMIPILRHFFTAAKVNQKMARIRNVEVMSENLMESLKTRTLDQILEQFALDDSNPLGVRAFELLPLWDGSIQYASRLNAKLVEDGVYEFGIDEMKIGSQDCDVRIQMDYKKYTESVLGAGNPNRYNDFPLPVLTNLDEKALVMLDSMPELEGVCCDDKAIQIFIQRRYDYIAMKDRQRALEEEDRSNHIRENEEKGIVVNVPALPPYTSPTAYSEAELESSMSKQITITLEDQPGNQHRVTAEVKYTVSDDRIIYEGAADQQIYQEVFYRQNYTNPILYLYLFYTPTRFHQKDEILLWKNQQLDAGLRPVQVAAYIIQQTATTVSGSYALKKDNACSSPVIFYTNMKSGSEGYQVYSDAGPYALPDATPNPLFQVNGMVEEAPYDQWIAEIQIDVFQAEVNPVNKYTNQIYSLSSSSGK